MSQTSSHISRLKDLAISETGFIFDPMSGATFTVNPTGACIIRALREGCGRAEIISRIHSAFTVANADLDSDLGEFVRLLVQQGILPHDFTLEPLPIPPAGAGTQSDKPPAQASTKKAGA
jgi:hypothetical protein